MITRAEVNMTFGINVSPASLAFVELCYLELCMYSETVQSDSAIINSKTVRKYLKRNR